MAAFWFVYAFLIFCIIAIGYIRAKLDIVYPLHYGFVKKMFDFDVRGIVEQHGKEEADWRIQHASKWCDIMHNVSLGEKK